MWQAKEWHLFYRLNASFLKWNQNPILEPRERICIHICKLGMEEGSRKLSPLPEFHLANYDWSLHAQNGPSPAHSQILLCKLFEAQKMESMTTGSMLGLWSHVQASNDNNRWSPRAMDRPCPHRKLNLTLIGSWHGENRVQFLGLPMKINL